MERKAFRMLTKTDFELYYPDRFQREVERVLDLGKDEKRLAKKELHFLLTGIGTCLVKT